MYLAPLNYDRFFKKIFSDKEIAKRFIEDFLEKEIEEITKLDNRHKVTDDAKVVEFDYRCKIKNGDYVIVDMQQWYKTDIIRRFYVYHMLNTALQLEKMPKKAIVTGEENSRNVDDYKAIEPAITLVWLVDDTIGTKENYVSYALTPNIVEDFLQNNELWKKKNIKELIEERTRVLKAVNNDVRDIEFLNKNKLIFMLQKNIVKNIETNKKYEKWFKFAEKTRKKENKEEDFEEFRNDKIFQEVIRRLEKNKLTIEDEKYIEEEAELVEMVKRYEAGVAEEAMKTGFKEGVEKGIKEGIKEGEKNKALEIGKKLLSEGIGIDIIKISTGLTKEEIEKLR